MFINFWYVAEESANVTDKPVHIKMLGQDFVLFRDSQGTARCLSNVCVHRGGFLANGKVKGDCIQCPYHGWEFDGAGACQRIPSLGQGAKVPSRAKVDAYPTVERYGLIFAFLGDLPEEQRPPILEIPEYGKEGWRSTFQRFEFDFDYKRSIENGIDPSHNEFVHTTHIFTKSGEHYVPELHNVEDEWGSGFWNKMPAPPLTNEKMRAASDRYEAAEIEVGTGHQGCSNLWTFIHPSAKFLIHQFIYETPVDDDRTRIFFINMRNAIIEPDNDPIMVERNVFVVNQDRDVLLGIRPVQTPSSNTKETLVPADKPIARYREYLKEWEAKGWRIDSDKVHANKMKVAYAIPSPARRTSKGWTINSIPLVSPAHRSMAEAAE